MKVFKIIFTLVSISVWLYFIKQETGWVTMSFCALQYAMWWISIKIIGEHNKVLDVLVK